MTNKEAIRTLEANYPDACFEQLIEAVDAAIEALKAQEVSNNSSELDNNIGDLIRRSATIDAVCKAGCGSGYCGISCDDVKAIEQLPSAQADSKELSSTHKALDTVSRQAAIEAHYEYCNKHPDAGFPVWSLKILEDLPSAEPETHEERTETHACDCISRQAAMDANTRER